MKTLAKDAIDVKSDEVEALAPTKLERRNYFPTMIFQGEIERSEELNKDLLASVYAAFDKAAPAEAANDGEPTSWRSAKNLHKRPEFESLRTKIESAFAMVSSELRYSNDHFLKISSMWTNINPPGSGNRAECRPGNLWTGCYCVQVPKGTGSMKFVDPRTINIMNPPKYGKNNKPRDCFTKVEFKPRAGHLIIFPAWLYHEVETNMAQTKGRAGDYVYISFTAVQAKK